MVELQIYQKINQLIEKGEQAVLTTIVNATEGTPRKLGAKMLVLSDGSIIGTIGGGLFEKQVIDRALEVCKTGEPFLLNSDLSASSSGIGAVCGGQISIFMEPVLKSCKLFIFGGGHVGKAIAEMAQFLDFNLHIIDDRPEWANKENYPMDCILWTGNMLESAENIPTDKNSFIIVLTRSWKFDEGIMRRLLKKDYTYMGVIGSKNKISTHISAMKKDGFEDEDFNRMFAPIGLPIGAYSPHEIAVSILGEIIAVQKGKRGDLPGWRQE